MPKGSEVTVGRQGPKPGCGPQIQSSFADFTWGQVCFQAGPPDTDCEQEESVQSGRATYSRKKQLSLEENRQVPTGKREQVTGEGQGSDWPAPAGPMNQSVGDQLMPRQGGRQFLPLSRAGPRTRHRLDPPGEGSLTTYHNQM